MYYDNILKGPSKNYFLLIFCWILLMVIAWYISLKIISILWLISVIIAYPLYNLMYIRLWKGRKYGAYRLLMLKMISLWFILLAVFFVFWSFYWGPYLGELLEEFREIDNQHF